jgi:phytol kinase
MDSHENNIPVPTNNRVLILDIDGVVLRGTLLFDLARRRGLVAFGKTMGAAFLFEAGRIELEAFLQRSYDALRGMGWDEIWDAYGRMALRKNTLETIRQLREAGWIVWLVSAGVPDEIVQDLVARTGADAGAGIKVHHEDGSLTGTAAHGLGLRKGKAEWAAARLEEVGLNWDHVAAVGDDRNNLPLMRKASLSIGFRATSSVRSEAPILIDEDDLAALIPALEPKEAEAEPYDRLVWHSEIVRKLVHLTGLAIPPLFIRWPMLTLALLVLSTALYLAIESLRLNGLSLPIIGPLGRLAIRPYERRHIASGPLTLALGVGLTLCIVPLQVACACVIMAVVADSLAAVVGGRWGRIHWPWNSRKTLEGSTAFLVGAWVCALIFVPWPVALAIAIIGALLESLPIRDWDNVLTPVGTGLIMGTTGVLMSAPWCA